jgi:hypothetical protein
MQAWLVVAEGGTRLRLADDRWGKHLWPTEAEAVKHEAVVAQQREAEARAREVAETQAREAVEKALCEQEQAREAAEAEVRALRLRLAELEALHRPQREEGGPR